MAKSLMRLRSLLLLTLVSAASAARASDFHSPREAGLGGAGHAGPLNTDAIYLNPSYVSLVPAYAVGASYYTYSGESPNLADYHGMGYNASIQDGKSEFFQAGVGYTQRQDVQIVNLGASRQVVQQLGVGIGGKYVRARDLSGETFWDSVVSSTYIFSNSIQAAVVVDNLVQSASGEARGFYREIIVGTKYNFSGMLLLYFDPHTAPSAASSWGYESGAELPIFTDFYLRGGMFKQSNIPFAAARGNGYCLGAGWAAPKISFDYGFEHAVSPVGAFEHVFGFTIFI